MEPLVTSQAVSKKVLIVDDGPDNIMLLSARLRGRYQLLTADDGLHALDLALQEPKPDLILLDIMMPGMDGYEVCRRLKSDQRTQDIPVIFLTALTESDDEAQGFSLGAVDYITKPFAFQSLNARIDRQLALSQQLRHARLGQELDPSQCSFTEQVRRLEQGKEAMLGLARTAFDNGSFAQQMESALDHILSAPCLAPLSQGAIFLTNETHSLSLVAQRNLSIEQQQSCSRIAQGHGLCGRAAQRRQPVYAKSTELCEHCLSGAEGRAAYSLPLLDGDELLGVLVAYLPQDHIRSHGEPEVMKELSDILAGVVGRRLAEERIKLKQVELQHSRIDTIHRLALASEYRDTETGLHILRMGKMAARIAAVAGLDAATCEQIEQAAPMHDLGKIGIRDDILLKPGQLTADEFELMKRHTLIGARILEHGDALMRMAYQIALHHHEHWDGNGYPNGVAGRSIPIAARICAIADVFDALLSERPYKNPWPVEQAVAFIQENRGTRFDPELVDAFLQALPDLLRILAQYSEGPISHCEPMAQQAARELSDQETLDGIHLQHRHLLQWVDRLHSSLIQGQGTQEIGQALLALDRYCRVHFAAEERIMEQRGYRNLAVHARLHRAFEAKLERLKRQLQHNPLVVGAEVVEGLKRWLLNHIQKVDAGLHHQLTPAVRSPDDLKRLH